jgi:hypothetical protein
MRIEKVLRLLSEVCGVARVAGLGVAVRYVLAVARCAPGILRNGTLAAADAEIGRVLKSLAVRSHGVTLLFPGRYFGAIREMYARDVYLRNGGDDPE